MLLRYARDLAKSKLSPEQLAGVRRVRGWTEANLRLPIVSARLVSRLGQRTAAETKERIAVVGKLDYPKADILLTLDSKPSLIRLNACTKEPDTVAWLERTFKPGDVLYDIGANVGAYSFVANAVAGGNCQVYAFEPSASTFANLCQNILLNHCSQTVCGFQVALSDSTGLVSFHYSNLSSGASMHAGIDPTSIDGDANGNRARHVQTMLCYQLDDFVEQFKIARPTHLKVDVDGPELAVLRGARKLLTGGGVRSLLVEVDELRYPDGQIEAFLGECGYRVVEKYSRITAGAYNFIFERNG